MAAYDVGPSKTPDSSSGYFLAVSPHDTTGALPGVSRAIWVGGAGNLAVQNSEGNSVTFVGVAAGTMLPIRTNHVMGTNTTATNIVALF